MKAAEWYRGRLLRALGYDLRQWIRVAQHRAWKEKIRSLSPANLDAFEVSPQGKSDWAQGWRSYTAGQYPDFDICAEQAAHRQFDVVIADQILEHVSDPLAAVHNMHAMLRPGGTALVGTPFLLGVHASPHDYSRWTEAGIAQLLRKVGFRSVETGAWGNRAAVKANLNDPPRYPKYGWWKPMKNEPAFPMVVWAFATK
jgi:SAM-dependent methyltransferase